MDGILLIILLIITLLLLICVYRVYQSNAKIDRLKRRYDKLLRGRGDYNLEELLGSHAEDIEMTLDRLEEIEKTNQSINKDLDINKNTFIKEIEKNIGSIDGKLSNEIFKVDNRLGQRLEKAEKAINDLNKTSNDKIDNYKDKILKELHKNAKQMKNEYNQLFNRLDELTSSKFDKFLIENKEFRENITKETNEKIREIGDRLAFAVQKTVIHRYNALDNQTGDLSFTIVLLDQFNNGIMFTCINGRESSYTYSKEIENGKSDYDFSPEEEIAIKKALK